MLYLLYDHLPDQFSAQMVSKAGISVPGFHYHEWSDDSTSFVLDWHQETTQMLISL